MKIFAEYHCHTIYSDGKSTMEEMVAQGQKIGLSVIGISDHGYKHLGFGVKKKDYPKMRDEVNRLQEKYPDIKILLGVEANILDDKGNLDVDDYVRNYIDYALAGYHFGSTPQNLRGVLNHSRNYIKSLKAKEIDYNTNAIIETIKNNEILAITHPGDKGWVNIEEIAKVAENYKVALEINAHHEFLSKEQLEITKKYDLKYILGSDAHHKEHFKKAELSLKRSVDSGIDLTKIINLQL